MKKGFTLIELLAVIIILAVIALIATPIVLDVVENAKEESRLQSVNGIIDATRLYTNEAMLNEELSLAGNLYDNVKDRIQGQVPDSGEVYVNENNQVAMAIKLDKYCYVKKYNGEITKTEQEDCLLYPPTDESCFEYRQLVDYTINYDACMQVLSAYEYNGKIYSEEDRNLICTGEIASDDASFEAALDLGLFDVNGLIGLNVISNVEYKDEVSITNYKCYVGNTEGQEEISDVVIPSKLNNLPVRKIGINAFSQKSLTSVYFLGEVEEICNSAFFDNQISNLDLSNLKNLKKIDDHAFQKNQLSGTLDLSNFSNLTSVSGFYFNQLTKVILPKSVEKIGDTAFNSNQLSGELDLSGLSNLKIIDDTAFCSNNLSSLNLSGLTNLETIARSAFSGNQISSLNISGLPNLETIDEYAFHGNGISSLNLKNLPNLKTIGECAFRVNELHRLDLSGLTNLETIEDNAFSYNNLEEIILPRNIINIGRGSLGSGNGTTTRTKTLPDGTIETITVYNNTNLSKIVNPTGKVFDWKNIISSYSGTAFETGSVTTDNGTVTITKE